MTPQEVLHAIPRQKVKHWGKTYEVLCLSSHENPSVHVIGEDGKPTIIFLENCTPVPEEPRKLKVGDKVVRVSDDDYGGKAIMYGEVTSKRKDSNGEIFYEVAGWHTSERGIRHCTPQEVADHFA